jgi:hypothetical protein
MARSIIMLLYTIFEGDYGRSISIAGPLVGDAKLSGLFRRARISEEPVTTVTSVTTAWIQSFIVVSIAGLNVIASSGCL